MGIDGMQFFLLCEDRAQQNFVWHWLRAKNVPQRKIRKLPIPAGRKGAGDKFVLDRLPAEVKHLRGRHASSALIVATDVDSLLVAQRQAQLDATLTEDGQASRGPTERICLLIPRRNIETWVHLLLDHLHPIPANETDDFKEFNTLDDCREAARRLAKGSSGAAGLPSLSLGVQELARLQ